MSKYDKLTELELLVHRRYIEGCEAGGDYSPQTLLRAARYLLDHIDATEDE